MERCAAAMQPWAHFSLLEELGRSEETSQMQRTEIAQPAIFAMQVALAALGNPGALSRRRSSGIASAKSPRLAWRASFRVEEAARVIALRARFMDECARGDGTMLAVGLDEEEAARVDRPARSHRDHCRLQWAALAHPCPDRAVRWKPCWRNSSRRACSPGSCGWIIPSTIH